MAEVPFARLTGSPRRRAGAGCHHECGHEMDRVRTFYENCGYRGWHLRPRRHVAVAYWMNRLQSLQTAENVFVTLNRFQEPKARLTHVTFTYHHPQFNRRALAAQAQLPLIQGGNRVWFCGSYCGYGFHEDGLHCGLAVAAALGQNAPWAVEINQMSRAWQIATPTIPALAAE